MISKQDQDLTVIVSPEGMIPIQQTINIGEQYECSRNLFSFVNRSLNAIGLQASDSRLYNRCEIEREHGLSR